VEAQHIEAIPGEQPTPPVQFIKAIDIEQQTEDAVSESIAGRHESLVHYLRLIEGDRIRGAH
jgi:hypothetical protein